MAIYTRRLAVGYQVGAGFALVYTVPDGTYVVVRDVVLMQNDSDAPRRLGLALFPTGGGANGWIVSANAQPRQDSLHWEGRVALEPGDTIQVYTTSPATTFWVVTGYVFAGG